MITFQANDLIIVDNIDQEELYLLVVEKQIYLRVNYGSMHSDTINFEKLANNGVSDATINELKEMYKEEEEEELSKWELLEKLENNLTKTGVFSELIGLISLDDNKKYTKQILIAFGGNYKFKKLDDLLIVYFLENVLNELVSLMSDEEFKRYYDKIVEGAYYEQKNIHN